MKSLVEWVPRRFLPGQLHSKAHYAVLSTVDPRLPFSSSRPEQPPRNRRPLRHAWFWRPFTVRNILCSLAFAPICILGAILLQGIPPTYQDIRTFEQRLPQHSISAWSSVDGVHYHHPRYLRFPGHLWGHGLNNVLQEACVLLPLFSISVTDREPRHLLFLDSSCRTSHMCQICHSSSKTIPGHVHSCRGQSKTLRYVQRAFLSMQSYLVQLQVGRCPKDHNRPWQSVLNSTRVYAVDQMSNHTS